MKAALQKQNSGRASTLRLFPLALDLWLEASRVRLAPPSDHIRLLEVQSVWPSLLPNTDPGVIVCFSLSKTTKTSTKKTPSSNSNCATVNSGSVADGPVLEHHDSRRPPPSFQNKQLLWRDCAQSTGTAYYCLLCVQDDTLPCAHELGTQQFILTPHADMMHYNMGSLFLLSFFFGLNEKNNRFLSFGGNKRSERSIIKSAATFFFSINC